MIDYQVQLQVFEGPLDLLLRLIRRRELDITKVALAKVTDQYLDYLGRLEEIDPGALAEFVAVAAKLLLIKSQFLLPGGPLDEDEEEEDVGEELARQLMAYKRVREAAEELREREKRGLRVYVRTSTPPRPEPSLDPGEVSLDELLTAVRQALDVQPDEPPVDEVVQPWTVTVSEKIAEMEDLLQNQASFSFGKLLAAARSRVEVIVSFLALLELMKQRAVTVRQDTLFGEIVIHRR